MRGSGAGKACGRRNADDASAPAPALPRTDRAPTSRAGWAVDFQLDAATDDRPIRLVSIIDEHTRECLYNLVDLSVTADVLIDELDRLRMVRGPAVRGDGRLGRRTRWAVLRPARGALGGTATSSRSIHGSAMNVSTSASWWSLAQGRVVITDWKDDCSRASVGSATPRWPRSRPRRSPAGRQQDRSPHGLMLPGSTSGTPPGVFRDQSRPERRCTGRAVGFPRGSG